MRLHLSLKIILKKLPKKPSLEQKVLDNVDLLLGGMESAEEQSIKEKLPLGNIEELLLGPITMLLVKPEQKQGKKSKEVKRFHGKS